MDRQAISHKNTLYVVDPDDSIGDALATLLGASEIAVRMFADAEHFQRTAPALDKLPACLMTHANLPGLSGISLLRQLRTQGLALPIILLTDTFDNDMRQRALRFGATEVIEKSLLRAFLNERLSEPLTAPLEDVFAKCGVELSNGATVIFRVIRPQDAEIEQEFVRGLSASSKHLRFFSAMKQLSPELLRRFTHPHFPDHYALIATVLDDGHEREIGVARYLATDIANVTEFAVVVADDWQGLGIASRLVQGLTAAAAVAGIERLDAIVLRDNQRMLKLAKEWGFSNAATNEDATVVHMVKHLRYITGVTHASSRRGDSHSQDASE